MIINSYIFGGFDPDAQAFITAANITDNTQKTAINQLVLDLKAYNIWSKMKAIYPFVGGTASTHKFNLKDPRDLDAAFRLVFNGGWTHSSTGALPNGTNGYADTKLNASSNLGQFSTSMSYYSRTINDGPYTDAGAQQASNLSQRIVLNFKYSGVGYYDQNDTGTGRLSVNMSSINSNGLFLMSRTANNIQKAFRNGSQIGSTNNNTISTLLPTSFIWLGAYNGSIPTYTNRECAFATIGDGLTDTDVTNLSWITEQYQTTLGRSVNPWYNNGNLLLDNYPSAAVAYSVRKLRNYYIGAAIRVRRSSDNAEQDIFFDSTGNLDTTSLLSFVGAGNGFVTTWYDQSGNAQNLTQTTAANQPRIVNAGVLETISGKASMQFDGSNDAMYVNFPNIVQPNYYSIVTTKPNSGFRFVFDSSSGGRQVLANSASDTSFDFNAGTTISGGNTLTAGIRYLINILANSTNSYVYTNNNLYVNANAGTNGIIDLALGYWITSPNTNNANIKIQEFIIYPSDQSANRTAINTNTNSYFNIYP